MNACLSPQKTELLINHHYQFCYLWEMAIVPFLVNSDGHVCLILHAEMPNSQQCTMYMTIIISRKFLLSPQQKYINVMGGTQTTG